jgi:hypothetical protein
MPRYYLHIRDEEGRLVEDPDGSELPDLEAARAEALTGARAVLAEKVRAGELIGDQRFEITDEAGTVLTIIPMKDVLRLT